MKIIISMLQYYRQLSSSIMLAFWFVQARFRTFPFSNANSVILACMNAWRGRQKNLQLSCFIQNVNLFTKVMCVTLVTAATKWHRTPAEFDTRLCSISIGNYTDRDEKIPHVRSTSGIINISPNTSVIFCDYFEPAGSVHAHSLKK